MAAGVIGGTEHGQQKGARWHFLDTRSVIISLEGEKERARETVRVCRSRKHKRTCLKRMFGGWQTATLSAWVLNAGDGAAVRVECGIFARWLARRFGVDGCGCVCVERGICERERARTPRRDAALLFCAQWARRRLATGPSASLAFLIRHRRRRMAAPALGGCVPGARKCGARGSEGEQQASGPVGTVWSEKGASKDEDAQNQQLYMQSGKVFGTLLSRAAKMGRGAR